VLSLFILTIMRKRSDGKPTEVHTFPVGDLGRDNPPQSGNLSEGRAGVWRLSA
jgi:hypothetical protein